jgi:type III secretion protein S
MKALLLMLYISAPVLIAVTVVGLLIGLFQALTSIQEQTLPHSFKFFAAVVVIALSSTWAGEELGQYFQHIFFLISKM